MPTAYWSPNQAAIKQKKTHVFSAPNSVGNTYNATINGKTVTYTSVSGDTAATCCTGLYSLLADTTSCPPEINEIDLSDSTTGTLTTTAKIAGTPFADVPGTSAGLVFSTGNGLANGITSTTVTANKSPSDVNDPQNWLRVTTPAPGVRQLPQNGDDVDVRNSSVPMLWNLDQLANVQFQTYTRWGTMTGQIGLPFNNPNGYNEWRAQYFKFTGPTGSVPSGGLVMVIGQGDTGNGPPLERYDTQSQPTTLNILKANTVDWLGVHTANTFTLIGGATLNIAMQTGEIASLASSSLENSTVNMGAGLTWTATSTLTMFGGSALLNSAPATLSLSNGAQVTVAKDGLTWPAITAKGGSSTIWLAGGIVTTITMETGSTLDKTRDLRGLTITNSTIDGDTCAFIDPNNTITYTNATSVKQQVQSGPFQFTGTKTVKVT